MTGFCRRVMITGAAVLLYCLTVSLGPDLIFGGASPNTDSDAGGVRVAELP